MLNEIHLLDSGKKVSILGAALGWGAQIPETEQGPEYLYSSPLRKKMDYGNSHVQWEDILYPLQQSCDCAEFFKVDVLPLIIDFVSRLSDQVQSIVKQNKFPLVFGGDHSLAIGTWNGVMQALKASEQFGWLWMDAHMDSHTPETSPSQAYHGMPVATLMGYGETQLTHLSGSHVKIDPAHIVLYGIRSYEPEEKALLEDLGVRIYYIEEINQRGIEATLNEAVTYLNQNTKGFGISMDLDVFDPLEVPGVGSPESYGLSVKKTLPMLSKIVTHPGLRAFELTEFNPQRDRDNKTLQIAQEIVEIVVKAQMPTASDVNDWDVKRLQAKYIDNLSLKS